MTRRAKLSPVTSRPLGPRPRPGVGPFSLLLCPHPCPGGGRCNARIVDHVKFPPSWHVYATALRDEADATGRGFVKQCESCRGWVEVVLHTRAAA